MWRLKGATEAHLGAVEALNEAEEAACEALEFFGLVFADSDHIDEELNTDPHQSEKSDPDPDPYQSENPGSDPDPQLFMNFFSPQ
jgi:hypothetical protein